MRLFKTCSLTALVIGLTSAVVLAGAGTALFNGKDLTGWRTKDGQSLEGKTDAYKGRFKVENGEIVIDPAVKGDVHIYTTREFAKDVVIRFEFKPGKGCNNDLFFRGNKFDIKSGMKSVKDNDWNELVMEVKGDQATFKINGTVEKASKGKGAFPNSFGIRAEFGSIAIRKVTASE